MNDARLAHIRERVTGFRPDPSSAPTNRAVEDMQWLVKTVDDLRSRLACVVEATYWDRPYDTRIDAIRGMCDLTTNGMSPIQDGERLAQVWDEAAQALAWCLENGPAEGAAAHVAAHNPYRVTRPGQTAATPDPGPHQAPVSGGGAS